MSATPLLPQAFWFRMAIPCRKVEGIPRPPGKGKLLDLPEGCRLPDFGRLEGKPSWVEVRVGWNDGGLGIAFDITGKPGPLRQATADGIGGDGVHLWVDTRDTRDVHRATKFCHRFWIAPGRTGAGGTLIARIDQKPIARAIADAPAAKVTSIPTRVQTTREGWQLELFLPADSLHGFDPETNRRLGFLYQVVDPDREDQFLGVGREFPVGEDPSLWATLELRD